MATPWDVVADESVVAVMAHLPARCIAHAARSCRSFWNLSQADVLWLPLARSRWGFGKVMASSEQMSPGLRDQALATKQNEAALSGLQNTIDAFAFFRRRAMQDLELALLVLQLSAECVRPVRSRYVSGLERRFGEVVEICGSTRDPQLNGLSGVIFHPVVVEGEGQHFQVVVPPSMRILEIDGDNLKVLRRDQTALELRTRILGFGQEAIDELVRIVALPTTPTAGKATNIVAKGLLTKVVEAWAVNQWNFLVEDENRVDLLEEGALVLSQWAAPGEADVQSVRATLKGLADKVEARVRLDAPVRDRVNAVCAVLFDDFGLNGNVSDYYDPLNSFLHSVLERRRGIPISLSIVWTAVARRVSLPCFLCTEMPAHIVIRVETGTGALEHDLYVDAFGQKVMDFSDLQQFVLNLGVRSFRPQFVRKNPSTSVYARMMRNLMNIYEKECNSARDPAPQVDACDRLSAACAQAVAILGPCSAMVEEGVQARVLAEAARQRAESLRSELLSSSSST
mmetsp:Transcript_25319/g.72198  ORF Transcript_25319/g.72198 Transcript_25319/m.72198 type:complete len:512 (-) Transcript_25319:145-1680(-)